MMHDSSRRAVESEDATETEALLSAAEQGQQVFL